MPWQGIRQSVSHLRKWHWEDIQWGFVNDGEFLLICRPTESETGGLHPSISMSASLSKGRSWNKLRGGCCWHHQRNYMCLSPQRSGFQRLNTIWVFIIIEFGLSRLIVCATTLYVKLLLQKINIHSKARVDENVKHSSAIIAVHFASASSFHLLWYSAIRIDKIYINEFHDSPGEWRRGYSEWDRKN